MDYQGEYTGPQIDERLTLAGSAYQKPETGIPLDDLSQEVLNGLTEKKVFSFGPDSEKALSINYNGGCVLHIYAVLDNDAASYLVMINDEAGIFVYRLGKSGNEPIDFRRDADVLYLLGIHSEDIQVTASVIAGNAPEMTLVDGSYEEYESYQVLNPISYYIKPDGGIPFADLAETVQNSLIQADNAVIFSEVQALEPEEKEQARANIGAMQGWHNWGKNNLYIDTGDNGFLKKPILVLAMPGAHSDDAALYSICRASNDFQVTLLYGSPKLTFVSGQDEIENQYVGIIRSYTDYSIYILQFDGDETPISTVEPTGYEFEELFVTYYATQEELYDVAESKQDVLISGDNIKTINGEDILGEGDLELAVGQKLQVGDSIGSYIIIPTQLLFGCRLDVSTSLYDPPENPAGGSLLIGLSKGDVWGGRAIYSGTPYEDIFESVRIMNDGEDDYLVIQVASNTYRGKVSISYIGDGVTARVAQNVNDWETILTITPVVLEEQANKVTTLSGNESSTEAYPCTKAVFDAIHPATQSSQPSGGMLPNVLYNFGTLSGNTTFSINTTDVVPGVNHYYWMFDTPVTAPTITWPTGITWADGAAPTISGSKHYEISLLNGVAIAMEV